MEREGQYGFWGGHADENFLVYAPLGNGLFVPDT